MLRPLAIVLIAAAIIGLGIWIYTSSGTEGERTFSPGLIRVVLFLRWLVFIVGLIVGVILIYSFVEKI